MARGTPPFIVEAGREQAGAVRLRGLARMRRYGLTRGQLAWLLFLPAVVILLAVLGYPTGGRSG